MTPLACIACGRTDPCPDCRHHNRIHAPQPPTALPYGDHMSGKDHMDTTRPPLEPLERHQKPRCQAMSKQTGQQCGNKAIPGGTVCRFHGGGARQVRNRARLNLLELVDPAIATLAREMATAEGSSDRQRAANSILDRAGVVRRVDGTPLVDAQEYLVRQLIAIRDGQAREDSK